jgi:alpha-L-rhamnosidase
VTVVEGPKSGIFIQDAPADVCVRTIAPILLSQKGDCRIYDSGENITGFVTVRLHGAAGAETTVKYTEELDEAGELDPVTYTTTGEPHCDLYISDGTERDCHPEFLWQAFRYFSVTDNAEPVSVTVLHANVPVTARFKSSSETLNWIFNAFIRTQLCNMHCAIPSDCPQREGRGYTGDGQLACDAAMLTLSGEAFYRKWLRDIVDGQDKITGHINYTAPYIPSGGGPGGWGCAIVHVPYVYYRCYGDASVLRDYYPNMLRYFDYLELHSERDLVVSDEPGNWCLGDWCTPGELQIPEPFVNTYFYIKSLEEIKQIAEILGKTEDIPRFDVVIQRKKQAVLDTYFDEKTGDFAENIQGANAFAIDIGMGDERTFAHMLARYTETGMYDTGIFGTDVVTRVLFYHGAAQTAFDLLTSEKDVSFYNIKSRGATTFWEYWDGKHSHSHPMFGAVARYLFRDILGIRQREGTTGFTDIIVEPNFVEGLTFVAGSIVGRGGEIRVSIKKENGKWITKADADDGVRLSVRG